MRIQYPNSFLKLLLIGFAFAILPLIMAFINANLAFNQLSKNSQNTIDKAVKTTRASHMLQEQLHLMERSARQFLVLNDFEFLENYHNTRAAFLTALQELIILSPEAQQRNQLLEVKKTEAKLNLVILHTNISNLEQMPVLNDFQQLTQQVNQLILRNNQSIDNASAHLVISASKAQQRFFLQSLILVPFALLVAGAIAFMLGRPIQRMDTVIKDLGKGEYQNAISIDGPGDLRLLGQRLDWLRQELLHLKEQKQRFLQHISHELKTPLTAIREASELLTDGIGGTLSPQQHEIAHILKDNSLRLQKMIENLLTFTKMESDKHVMQVQALNINEIVSSVLASHALTIRNKQLHIDTRFWLGTIYADAETFKVMLDNLISNAVKFTPQAGQIVISTRQDKPWQLIEVQDSGPGLSKEDINKLFDPFYQGKTLHQGLVNSSGLGLTIVKNLVELHQGSIELKPEDKGAHVVIRLPRTDML
ncbi:HAMP domain-containing sensor histidine kinase [Methylotenera sp. 1P/1]|jgi:two-component system sensor histidine kinase GlrK|uniref:sensor histidine kinase n=1 Tax=Methylotenera sp. 1P/1 TaxID=1131551 RepID=UPI00038017EC|nr:HAMP domain-containing sensor histidine kinase [Methylotenera sp. 1P/1]